MGKGTSLKFFNCKTTNETTIISADLRKLKYPKGSFIKMDPDSKLFIEDFTFTGRINFNFVSFFKSNSINIKNL